MRDTLDISSFDSQEISPLIPDPPIKRQRVKQRSNCCHACWSRFTCCSKWTIIFIAILVIILVLIIVRSVLPFGWPWWVPQITFDSSDPHIIVIVADDVGWGDLGYGGAEFPTTNIDLLREQGISLNKMYVHQSGSATRAALLTGIPGYDLGLQNGIETGSSAHIPLDVRLLPEILRSERGYATHAVGKWALGYSKWDYTPTRRGFDTFLGFHQRFIDYWHYAASNFDSESNEMLMGYDLWKDNKVYAPPIKMQYVTEIFDNEIASILDTHNEDNAEQPLFLYYSPPNAHTPIQYHYEYATECSYIGETSELIRYKYCNLMQELDASVGSLIAKLKETAMWDRTVILFSSDNGGLMCWDVGSVNTCSGSVNLPLRGGKGTLFEGSIRVRSILSGGYLSDSLYGTSNNELMHSADIFSTLLSAANVNVESVDLNVNTKGLSFWEFLTNNDGIDAPVRESPFIGDMTVDVTASYIEKAALFWKGYKYIIQPVELYDGWWESPLQGAQEIPFDSEGIATAPQPLPQKPHPIDPNTMMQIENIEWSTLRMNEYLFNIDEDPTETKNIRMNPENTAILQELRSFLTNLAGEPDTYNTQDSAPSVHANPTLFDNVWYPFEEKYHK